MLHNQWRQAQPGNFESGGPILGGGAQYHVRSKKQALKNQALKNNKLKSKKQKKVLFNGK